MQALRTFVNGTPSRVVGIEDRGLQYGDGLFETIAVAEGLPLLLQAHLIRLRAGAARLGLGPLPSDQELAREIDELCRGMPRGVAKLVVTRGEAGRGYRYDADAIPTRILSLWPWPAYVDAHRRNGIALRVCRLRLAHQPVLAGIKHLNRLEQVLARAEWRDEYQEGLMCDARGLVIEGTMSNVFAVVDGVLFTPDLGEAGVAGLLRESVLGCARDLGIDCRITPMTLDMLGSACELFMTNSIIGIWPVQSLEGRPYPVGPLTRRIQTELEKRRHVAISSQG
jgi:4-amino-4-deoxychorismate lyase